MGQAIGLDKCWTESYNGNPQNIKWKTLPIGCPYGLCRWHGGGFVEFKFEKNIGRWFLVAGCLKLETRKAI